MLKFIEGSKAIAEAIKLCRPEVVAVYPITPQTHIIEHLAKLKTEGRVDCEYIKAESEMAAASAVLGASAAGTRVYTASASQGLLLMTEVLFNIAGLRLPVVMTCANRAVSAPINIWNDEQDALTIRDAGWIMLFAENNQEAVDLHIQAYKIAEQTNLPVMICVDGFSLTHTFEPVEIYDQKLVDKFLPRYKPAAGQFLNPKNPATLGGLSTPESYMPQREKLHQDLLASKKIIQKTAAEFKKIFRPISPISPIGPIQYTGPAHPKLLLVAMGSILGTIRHTIELKKITNVGTLKIKCFRPFPAEEISKIISKTRPQKIAIIDRAISLGSGGILANEIKNLCPTKQISSFIFGLGGKDVTPKNIEQIAKLSLASKICTTKFII